MMKNNNWKALLFNKLEVKTTDDFNSILMQKVRSEMKTNNQRESLFQFDFAKFFAPMLALSLILIIFIFSHINPIAINTSDPKILSSLIEQEDLLNNLTGVSEIEDLDNLNDSDWDILLAEPEDV